MRQHVAENVRSRLKEDRPCHLEPDEVLTADMGAIGV